MCLLFEDLIREVAGRFGGRTVCSGTVSARTVPEVNPSEFSAGGASPRTGFWEGSRGGITGTVVLKSSLSCSHPEDQTMGWGTGSAAFDSEQRGDWTQVCWLTSIPYPSKPSGLHVSKEQTLILT